MGIVSRVPGSVKPNRGGATGPARACPGAARGAILARRGPTLALIATLATAPDGAPFEWAGSLAPESVATILYRSE